MQLEKARYFREILVCDKGNSKKLRSHVNKLLPKKQSKSIRDKDRNVDLMGKQACDHINKHFVQ